MAPATLVNHSRKSTSCRNPHTGRPRQMPGQPQPVPEGGLEPDFRFPNAARIFSCILLISTLRKSARAAKKRQMHLFALVPANLLQILTV